MTTKESRPYQDRAVGEIHELRNQGARSVCLVGPTGSGKTTMMIRALPFGGKGIWLTHRRELVEQARRELTLEVGRENVGVIMAGEPEHLRRRVQVASIQTLLARDIRLEGIEWLALDETHHFMADTYRAVQQQYPDAFTLGGTATPERADGRPLGDIFEHMVVAAQYSELIAGGYLVPVQVVRPDRFMGSDLAAEPLAAWKRFAAGQKTFAFYPLVTEAERAAERFRAMGVSSQVIEAHTSDTWRDDVLSWFRDGLITVLTNVACLTEGVDVPTASAVLSCRPFHFAGGMMQAFGRVLRPSEGKTAALIIDLTGTTHKHGLPTDDREYSLHGRAIARKEKTAGDEAEHSGREPIVMEVSEAELEVATTPGIELSGALLSLPHRIVKPKVLPPIDAKTAAKLKEMRRKHGRDFATQYLERQAREHWFSGEETP